MQSKIGECDWVLLDSLRSNINVIHWYHMDLSQWPRSLLDFHPDSLEPCLKTMHILQKAMLSLPYLVKTRFVFTVSIVDRFDNQALCQALLSLLWIWTLNICILWGRWPDYFDKPPSPRPRVSLYGPLCIWGRLPSTFWLEFEEVRWYEDFYQYDDVY
jgi:hypothetical protein